MKKIVSAVVLLASMFAASSAYANGHHKDGGCMKGYHWYPDQNACIEMHESEATLVKKEACTAGEIRKVPDPSRPGGFRIQECRNLNANLD